MSKILRRGGGGKFYSKGASVEQRSEAFVQAALSGVGVIDGKPLNMEEIKANTRSGVRKFIVGAKITQMEQGAWVALSENNEGPKMCYVTLTNGRFLEYCEVSAPGEIPDALQVKTKLPLESLRNVTGEKDASEAGPTSPVMLRERGRTVSKGVEETQNVKYKPVLLIEVDVEKAKGSASSPPGFLKLEMESMCLFSTWFDGLRMIKGGEAELEDTLEAAEMLYNVEMTVKEVQLSESSQYCAGLKAPPIPKLPEDMNFYYALQNNAER